jgi:NAD(P)H-dependent FMN reductase
MTTILAISGSLRKARKASLNASLLRAAVELMPEGATLDANGIEGIPLYDGDEEAAHGLPPPRSN